MQSLIARAVFSSPHDVQKCLTHVGDLIKQAQCQEEEPGTVSAPAVEPDLLPTVADCHTHLDDLERGGTPFRAELVVNKTL